MWSASCKVDDMADPDIVNGFSPGDSHRSIIVVFSNTAHSVLVEPASASNIMHAM